MNGSTTATAMAAEMPNRNVNLRTALILLSVALAFFLGIIAKYWLFGG